MKSEVLKSRKVNDRWEKDSEKRDYLRYLNLREARVWVRYRTRMTKGVKANRNDMTCRCCEEDKAETQEHLEICKGTENEQRGLKNWNRAQTRMTFWKRMRRRIKDREEALRRFDEK